MFSAPSVVSESSKSPIVGSFFSRLGLSGWARTPRAVRPAVGRAVTTVLLTAGSRRLRPPPATSQAPGVLPARPPLLGRRHGLRPRLPQKAGGASLRPATTRSSGGVDANRVVGDYDLPVVLLTHPDIEEAVGRRQFKRDVKMRRQPCRATVGRD